MTKIVSDMAMSLDGFIAGPNDEAHGLHNYFFSPAGPTLEVIEEGFKTTGTIIMGRRAYDIGAAQDGFADNPYQVPIHLIPVLLGTGICLFDYLDTKAIELKSTGVIAGAGVTHLRFQIVK